ncbi:hypothetical protein [Halomonas sp. SL1]|uniref:hypothetical protein n=1 Tax=Halomonas sp. SL1 TaxID=2137478 RepID=UPI000DABC469|nr:hypothetical protein [Halomonas sp. SL1]RAH38800.1 hypothetical protein C9J49_003960 [Halomonas sp. SL1]
MPVTAPSDFGADDYAAALAASNADARPLSLHLRLPLRHDGDARVDHAKGMDPFEVDLARLDREMVLVRRCLAPDRRIEALHWGGSLPPWLSLSRMSGLVDRLASRFPFESGHWRDFTVELDPRATDLLTLRHLEALGFNRLKLVMRLPRADRPEALTRLQSRIEPLLDESVRMGWHSLNLVLIVPPATPEQEAAAALATLMTMTPPRLSLRPDPAWQEGESTLPATLLARIEDRLAGNGYRSLGGGFYARHGAALEDARAQTRREQARDRLGLGPGAISRLPDAVACNAGSAEDYAAALDEGRLATASGHWSRCRRSGAGHG